MPATHERQDRVAEHVPEVAAQHRGRVAHGVGEGAHGSVPFHGRVGR